MKPTVISHGPMDSNSLHPCPDLGSLISNFSISNFLSTIIDPWKEPLLLHGLFGRLPRTSGSWEKEDGGEDGKVLEGTDPGIDWIGASERKRISRILEETFDGWNPEEK